MTIPSSGIDWNTVSGTSPVPGGISISRTSSVSQMTSVQNCFTTPEMTGPRQTTGASGSSSIRLTETIWTPLCD